MDTQVSQLTHLTQRAHAYFEDAVNVSFEALAAPIDPALPSGRSIRGSSLYSAIEKARRADDATLPMGGWEHELKRADWDKVTALTIDGLRHKSKDLQIAAWLLEAQIHKFGFAGIGPCLMLMQTLCERYWDSLYPEIDNGDLDFRVNIFRWVNEKLLPALRLVPMIPAERDGHYSWADWEQARRNEQVRANISSEEAQTLEGPTLAQLTAAMAAGASEDFVWLYEVLTDALIAIDMLTETLDNRFGREAPSMSKLGDLLAQIHNMVEKELNKRGFNTSTTQDIPGFPAADEAILPTSQTAESQGTQATATSTMQASANAMRDRFDAYTKLAEIADFLMRIEPHSPTPYLIQRAVEWGRLNTADLYQELFLRLGGQLNIFEMLGLQPAQGNGDRQ